MEDEEDEVQVLEEGGRVEVMDSEEREGGAGDEDAELVDCLSWGDVIICVLRGTGYLG